MTATRTAAPPPGLRPHDPAVADVPTPRSVLRLRLAAIMLTLTLAIFAQSAGNASADTKIDLVVSPLRFLARALRLWDPIGGAGQLQNQAYGYLFPIGPFYAVLHALGVAPWELQRAFEAVIVCAAFLGTYLVAGRLGVVAFWPAVTAGLVYALAPRILGELTSISAELMPTAALPWVLLPLIDDGTRGSPRRAAARSGVALLFAGGVNAAATLAVLPVPALWLLIGVAGARRRALIGWWSLSVVLACAWWAIPLVQLARYSPPFLDWIETSAVTTSPTSLIASLRGVDHWEAYLGPTVWPGGWILAAAPAAIIATCLVAAGGLGGLTMRGVAHRAFLWATLLTGLVLLTAGHVAAVQPLGAGTVRHLLDGPLVPFRNIHKFDPVVRLPLALGVGHLLVRTRLPRRWPAGNAGVHIPLRALSVVAVAAVGVVAAAPVWTNHLVSSQRITSEPRWWSQAGHWLAGHAHGARALVVPATGAPEYLWGGTVDNAMQPVAMSPWTVRDSVPLAQPGYVRLLDRIDSLIAAGAPDSRLAPLLARAGIGYVVLANDLDTRASSATSLLYVRATLNGSPGLHPVAAFGPPLGGTLSPDITLDSGGTVSQPAVQIYSVRGWTGVAELALLSTAVAATGSADTLPGLLERGLRPDQAVLFGPDAAGLALAGAITTDGIRKREVSFAGVTTASVTMTEQQSYTQTRRVHDYLPADAGPLSAYTYRGIADVTASSAGTDNFAFINRGDLNGPWSAVDDDPASAWQSTGFGAVGQWLQVGLAHPSQATHVSVSFGIPDIASTSLPSRLTVTTERGAQTDTVLPLTGAQQLAVPPGGWRSLRITVAALSDPGRNGSIAISSLRIPGVDPVRSLQVPSTGSPGMLAFDVPDGYRSACLQLSVGPVCSRGYAASGQEDSGLDRAFRIGTAAQYTIAGTVRLRPGSALDDALDAGNPISAGASSRSTSDPQHRPGAAVDGDSTTTWQAAAGDLRPVLRLRWRVPRLLRGVTVVRPTSPAVAAPTRVTVTAGSQRFQGPLPTDGRIAFAAPVRTTSVDVRIDEAQPRPTTNSVTIKSDLEPPGIAEVRLTGGPIVAAPTRITVSCSAGVTAIVDGDVVPLSISAPAVDALVGKALPVTACTGPTELAAGGHRVVLAATSRSIPVSLTLTRRGFHLAAASPFPPAALRIGSWGATSRTVHVSTVAAAALLVVHENFNSGWQASLGGKRLRAVQVDGWEQAFVVPAHSGGEVALTYAPQRTFVLGLVIGALAVIALIVLLVRRPRRRAGADAAERPGPSIPTGVALIAIVGSAALLAGWQGLVTAAGVCVLGVLLGRAAGPVLATCAAAAIVIAALVESHGEQILIFRRQDSAVVQLLCVIALVAGACAAVLDRRRAPPT